MLKTSTLSSKRPLTFCNRPEAFFWLCLRQIPGVGNIIYNRLIKKFCTPEKVFQASSEELKKIDGLRSQTIEAIITFKDTDWAKKEVDRIEKQGITLITIQDERFPRNLKEIYDPPPFLYVKGELREDDNLSLAVVGSRNASAYGKAMTTSLSRTLTQRGFTIVSGLARGIDTCAHKGALEGGGRTVAVLGSGIDIIYPWENKGLAEEIALQGAIVSEFPLGTQPEAINFPPRNRIISGLSLGTVIVEASFRSGSLITARMALEQGREVFAVPGNVDSPRSKGTNRLIKEGAKLIMDPEDIIEEVFPQYKAPATSGQENPPETKGITPEGQKIFDLLDSNPLHIDHLIHQSKLRPNQVSSLLLELELTGLAKQLPGKMFIKNM
jgi:DNA processing protein